MSENTFKVEKQSRDMFQQPMLDFIKVYGATDIKVYPEGANAEQFEKGDLEYTLKGKIYQVDIKAEKVPYRSLGLFYETMSNAHTNRRGWARSFNYDKVWYVILSLKVMLVLDMKAWHEDAEEALKRGTFRELKQKKYAQANETLGFPCPLPWMQQRNILRLKENRPPLVNGTFFIENDNMIRKSSDDGLPLIINMMKKALLAS